MFIYKNANKITAHILAYKIFIAGFLIDLNERNVFIQISHKLVNPRHITCR